MSFLIVLTTVPNRKEAQKISQGLLKQRLAACVQISGPVESIYRWKGKIEKSKELQLWIKTKKAAFPKIERFIKQNHPYEVPEILAIPAARGSRSYLSWLNTEVLP